MWLLSSPQVADEPELKSTWCCRREGCWGAGITKSELQTSLGLSETLLWGGEGWQGSWCCCAVSGSGCLPKGASLLLCWFGRAQLFPTMYSISLSWAVQAEFQEYSVLELQSPPAESHYVPVWSHWVWGSRMGRRGQILWYLVSYVVFCWCFWHGFVEDQLNSQMLSLCWFHKPLGFGNGFLHLCCAGGRGEMRDLQPHRRRAVFLPEMEMKAFLSLLPVWGDDRQRGNADFQLTLANVPNREEEHFHFVFQLIFNYVQAKWRKLRVQQWKSNWWQSKKLKNPIQFLSPVKAETV